MVSERARQARWRVAGLLVATFVAVGAQRSAGQPPALESFDPPARAGSSSPALAAESVTTLRAEHDVLMTWLEPGPAGKRLRFARLRGQEWTQPVTIADGISELATTDRASLTVIDTQAVRRTLVARTGDVVARSGDAGRTWTRLPAGALPFASFAGGDEGGYAFWLEDDDGPARLLGTRILAGETVLDPSVTAASSTSAAMTWDGPVVVYRDAASEDISLIRRQQARWMRPRSVHRSPGWHPSRDPQSGPEVAALRRQLAVAWYTESPHRPRVLVAFSGDAGKTFEPPVEVDVKQGSHTPLPVVDVALAAGGEAAVLWMAASGQGEAVLNLALVSAAGERGAEVLLAEGPSPGAGGVPQMTRAGDRLAVTWVERQGLRVVTVPVDDLPAPSGRRRTPSGPSRATTSGASVDVSLPGQAGRRFPDTEVVDIDGVKVSVASLRGRPALINLWATWCVPCLAEMPELAILFERYRRRGLTMVGLSVDDADATDRVRAFVAEREIPFAIWLDPEMRLYSALRVRGLPVTFIVDRGGRIVLRREGAISAADPEVEEAIGSVLSGSSEP